MQTFLLCFSWWTLCSFYSHYPLTQNPLRWGTKMSCQERLGQMFKSPWHVTRNNANGTKGYTQPLCVPCHRRSYRYHSRYVWEELHRERLDQMFMTIRMNKCAAIAAIFSEVTFIASKHNSQPITLTVVLRPSSGYDVGRRISILGECNMQQCYEGGFKCFSIA